MTDAGDGDTMTATGLQAARAPGFDITPRHVVAAVMGNALEFYDFSTYAFFAVQIGRTFFPGRSPFESLMLSLATFGVGFLGRPIGAAIIGLYGDRVGRKPAMLMSLMMMGFSILALALTPSLRRDRHGGASDRPDRPASCRGWRWAARDRPPPPPS